MAAICHLRFVWWIFGPPTKSTCRSLSVCKSWLRLMQHVLIIWFRYLACLAGKCQFMPPKLEFGEDLTPLMSGNINEAQKGMSLIKSTSSEPYITNIHRTVQITMSLFSANNSLHIRLPLYRQQWRAGQHRSRQWRRVCCPVTPAQLKEFSMMTINTECVGNAAQWAGLPNVHKKRDRCDTRNAWQSSPCPLYWTDSHQIFSINSHMDVNDQPNICFAIAQKTLLRWLICVAIQRKLAF